MNDTGEQEKNGIMQGERVVCADAPSVAGTVIHCRAAGVTVQWDDGQIGELVWDDAVAYNAYRLMAIRRCIA